jgi:hypothetical protein
MDELWDLTRMLKNAALFFPSCSAIESSGNQSATATSRASTDRASTVRASTFVSPVSAAARHEHSTFLWRGMLVHCVHISPYHLQSSHKASLPLKRSLFSNTMDRIVDNFPLQAKQRRSLGVLRGLGDNSHREHASSLCLLYCFIRKRHVIFIMMSANRENDLPNGSLPPHPQPLGEDL